MTQRAINKLLKKGRFAENNKMIKINKEVMVDRFENRTLKNSQNEKQVMAARKSTSIF
tara:strand:+ start:322 stop:495 length:174 start_codon:yes stop_codon:yes gene_type:complete